MKPLIALLAFTNPAWAACLPNEEAFMACDIENSLKTLAVCFDDTTTHYRFGTAGQTPDLALSDPIETVDYYPWGGVGRSIAEGVVFYNEGYSYEVYAGFERMFGDEEYEDVPHRSFGGVRVFREGAKVVEQSCLRSSVEFSWGEGLYTAKTNLGFVWEDRDRVWIAQPD